MKPIHRYKNKKSRRDFSGRDSNIKIEISLRCFGYLSLLDAGCANAHACRASFDISANALKIREPAPSCLVVGVTDIVAANRLFTANCTNFSHFKPLGLIVGEKIFVNIRKR
jgi:hypothetical protein